MKYRYAILDTAGTPKISITYDNEDDAKKAVYGFRKMRYVSDHYGEKPKLLLEREYDIMRHDNNYNVIKYTVIA